MIWLVLFFIVLITIGIFDYRGTRNFSDYVVAGREQNQAFVMMSLLATTIGASATLGAVKLAYGVGFPAVWWLGAGSFGLILQGFLLSEKVRAFEGYTLPNIANIVVGEQGKLIISVIIVLSWIGIIAAQFVALSAIIAIITGNPDTIVLLVVTSLTIILYTTVGGQLSILKTDALQFVLLAGGLLYSSYYLFYVSPATKPGWFTGIQLINAKFDLFNLVYFLFIVGGSYFIGPDVFSRNFTAKTGKVARNATLKAGVLIIGAAILITLTGMWAKGLGVDLTGTNAFIYIISNHLPRAAALLLSFGLLSAIVSSADTCIITCAAIMENDILKRERLKQMRLFSTGIGLLALLIAIVKKDIIGLLLSAYSIFTPGIVCPLFIAIWFHNKRQLHKVIWITALLTGGSLGLLSNILQIKWLALVGMALSLILAILSLKKTCTTNRVK